MYCQNCGNQVSEDSKFCGYCGNPIISETVPMPEDDTPVPPLQPEDSSAHIISKRQYFATHGSNQAKTLIRAAWIVFAICASVSLILKLIFLFTFQPLKLFLTLQEVMSITQLALFVFFFTFFGIFIFFNFAFGAMACRYKSTGMAVTYLLLSFPFLMIWQVTVTFIAAAALGTSLPGVGGAAAFAMLVYYMEGLFPILTYGSFFDLSAAICIVTFICTINKEYKRYVREQQ